MKINFILSRKFYLHGNYSGYDKIIDYFDEKDVITIDKGIKESIFTFLPESIFSKLSGMDWYTQYSFLLELKLAYSLIKEENLVCHHIYGEDSYRFSKNFDFKKNKILCTFHQPPKLFEKYVKSRDHIKKLDGIIVLSNSQKDYFKKYLGIDKIFFVPHGIDTNFFTPKSTKPNLKKTCMSVGNWQRDFKTLRKVIELVSEREEVLFKVVTPEENFKFFKGLKNVELMSNLSDSELLNQYGASDVFLLPLLDCSANNAVLEALACGLPVVGTNVGGMPDYVDSSCAILVKKGDAVSMAGEVINLLKDEALLKKMGKNSRKRAEKFKWENIAKKVEVVYESV